MEMQEAETPMKMKILEDLADEMKMMDSTTVEKLVLPCTVLASSSNPRNHVRPTNLPASSSIPFLFHSNLGCPTPGLFHSVLDFPITVPCRSPSLPLLMLLLPPAMPPLHGPPRSTTLAMAPFRITTSSCLSSCVSLSRAVLLTSPSTCLSGPLVFVLSLTFVAVSRLYLLATLLH